jgi:hypothetical protein
MQFFGRSVFNQICTSTTSNYTTQPTRAGHLVGFALPLAGEEPVAAGALLGHLHHLHREAELQLCRYNAWRMVDIVEACGLRKEISWYLYLKHQALHICG